MDLEFIYGQNKESLWGIGKKAIRMVMDSFF
jgi:hypothetical protein